MSERIQLLRKQPKASNTTGSHLFLRAWSSSFPLDNLTQLILYNNWFTLLNPESSSTHERRGLKAFQFLISCLESHLDD